MNRQSAGLSQGQGVSSPVIRVARNIEDLRQSLALRFSARSHAPNFNHHGSVDLESRLALDGYDFWSVHFVMLEPCEAGDRVVGTIRLVLDRPSPLAWAVGEIATAHRSLAVRLADDRVAPLPVLSQHGSTADVHKLYARLAARRSRVAEPCGLALSPALPRANRNAAILAAQRLLEHAVSHAWGVERVDHLLVNSDPALEDACRCLAFRPVPNWPRDPQSPPQDHGLVLQASRGASVPSTGSGIRSPQHWMKIGVSATTR